MANDLETGEIAYDPEIEQYVGIALAEYVYSKLVMAGSDEIDAAWLAAERAGLKEAPHLEPVTAFSDSLDAAGITY